MKNNYSIIRESEYNMLAKSYIKGRVLDIGGSQKSGYYELLKDVEKIVTVNIDSEYGCDLIFDIQEPFPLPSDSFDHVICLNVLEHIYKFDNVVSESFRVLNGGGSFIIAVPFMFQIHGSPDDYFRYTKSCLIRLLEEKGFSGIDVQELGAGLFSLIFQTIGGKIPTMFLKRFIKKLCVLVDVSLSRFSANYRSFILKIPLGYFVIAKKSR